METTNKFVFYPTGSSIDGGYKFQCEETFEKKFDARQIMDKWIDKLIKENPDAIVKYQSDWKAFVMKADSQYADFIFEVKRKKAN